MNQNTTATTATTTVTQKAYARAADLIVTYELPAKDVEATLINEEGVSPEEARLIVQSIAQKAGAAKSADSKSVTRDIIWGSIWLIGGVILTFAKIGYIFWGAIVFGGFQLVRGIANKMN